MKHWPLLLLGGLAFIPSGNIHGHESRPAYLELTETVEGIYEMLWKVPARGPDLRLGLQVRLPDDCVFVRPTRSTYVGWAFVEHSTIRRAEGLAGSEILVEGLSSTQTDALIRVEFLNGLSQTYRLTPSDPSVILEAAPSFLDVAKTYTILGIQHILGGIDHLLFVLCLVLVAGINRKLLITITGFTIAHSLTLALSTLGVVNIPVPPVEAAIALSIVFLAMEIAKACQKESKEGFTYRYPIAVSVSFGLLHGFGFAAVLGEIGLPQGEIPMALLFFNVGVEIGQLFFVLGLVVAWKLVRLQMADIPLLVLKLQRAAVYVIGPVAVSWMIERVASFWG